MVRKISPKIFVFVGLFLVLITICTPATTYAASSVPAECPKSFFGLTPWYKYLGPNFKSTLPDQAVGGKCDIKCFRILPAKQTGGCGRSGSVTDVPYVLLAIIDSIARIAGIVSVAFVLSGAFKYITSSGNPEATARARNTIVNALIGVAVVIVAIGFIQFLGRSL